VEAVMAWEDFVQREGIEIPEFEDGADFSDFLEELADLPEDKHWTHEPKHVERVWVIEGRRYRILVWDQGNGYCDAIGVLVEVPTFTYIK